MDHQEGEDSVFNLYEHYGAAGMGDDDDGGDPTVAVVDDTTYPMDGWDRDTAAGDTGMYPDLMDSAVGYGQHDAKMEDFHQHGHEFHGAQHFEAAAAHEFGDYMVQRHGNQEIDDQHIDHDQHHQQYGAGYVYHTPTIYPNLTQTQEEQHQYVNQIPQSSTSVPSNNAVPLSGNGSITTTDEAYPKPAALAGDPSSLQQARQNFKFTVEQKQKMMEKFNAGLHYPTPAEKEDIGRELGCNSDSISRWFERTRKEKGVQRVRSKALDQKTMQMPQYMPLQPLQQQQQSHPQLAPQQQQQQQIIPSYGQFPSTYPYNTLNPQMFQQSFQNIQPNTFNPATIKSTTGMYAPIPFVNQSLHLAAGMQQSQTMSSNNVQHFQPQVMDASHLQAISGHQPPRHNVAVEITSPPPKGIYSDDTRNVKRPKIEPKPTTSTHSAKPSAPKKPLTFEQEVQSILRPSEWRKDSVQAAEDLYDLMGDAEDNDSPAQKIFLLRSIRTNATEVALRMLASEENRRILAKIRNWFTAGIKANDTQLLSVILEVIKKINIDGRTMAGIKMGKALILLMKKEEPTLKAQLASLSKTAYEAYALEKDSGSKHLKADNPVTTSTPATAPATAPATKELVKAPVKAAAPEKKVVPTKVKAADKPTTGATFFGKLASAQQATTPTITKTPVPTKPIPKRLSNAAASTIPPKPPSTTTAKPPPPPKPASTAKSAAVSTTSKFSVLEYLKQDSSPTVDQKDSATSTTNTKKRKHVSWAGEDKLEQVKLIENITIKYAEELFWHPPQGFGNARDLDIGEGMVFGKDTVEDEEEIEWYEPKLFDFSAMQEMEERGVKKGGTKNPESQESVKQKQREQGVLLVMYLNEADIPESPSEPFLEELLASQQPAAPKTIPLPLELKKPTAPTPVMGNPDVTAILSSLLGAQSAPGPSVYQPPPPPSQSTDLAALLQSLTGQFPLPQQPHQQIQPPIPSNVDLSALLSHLGPQQPPQQQAPQQPPPQRWTSPPPQQQARGSRQRRDRDPNSRIKASRMDDVRESVRNSQADQNQYRALCQFYVPLNPQPCL